jgi:hemin uptake protein HemP
MTRSSYPYPPGRDQAAGSIGGDGSGARSGDAAPPRQPRRVASDELFAGAVEVLIEHREQVYRLRRTSLGKLILTK